MISIEHKEFLDDVAAWYVQAHMDLSTGSRRCTHIVALPANATDEQLKAEILVMYKA